MDRRPPRDGVHRAAGPVGQLVQSSVHPSLQVDGSPSGEAWGPRDPVLLGLVIVPCHAEAPPLRHPHSDAPLSVRCSRSRRTPREPLDTRHDLLEQGPCQVDDTALAPVTSRSVISARRRRRLRRFLRLLGCGIGSSGVPRPSLADYVMGTGPRSGGDRRRRALVLAILESDMSSGPRYILPIHRILTVRAPTRLLGSREKHVDAELRGIAL